MSTIRHDPVVTLTTATFHEVVGASPVPVVVDFSAAWCPPCGPTAEALAVVSAERADAFVAATVDVDAEPELVRRFGIQAMPTLLVFVDGRVVDRLVGGRGVARLREDLAPHLP